MDEDKGEFHGLCSYAGREGDFNIDTSGVVRCRSSVTLRGPLCRSRIFSICLKGVKVFPRLRQETCISRNTQSVVAKLRFENNVSRVHISKWPSGLSFGLHNVTLTLNAMYSLGSQITYVSPIFLLYT